MLSMALITAAAAAPPAADAPAQAPAHAQAPPAAPPDDSLFEYLGTDDVDDAKWWEFLMKIPPAPPPTQEAGK